MKVVVIGMIYKSVNFLHLMLQEFDRVTIPWFDVDESPNYYYDVSSLVIANDPTQQIIDYLVEQKTNHLIYKDPNPDDYYLNRVYRAWNFGGMNADADIIVFVNSDMVFTNMWLENLLEHLNPNTIPVSRLVESGKMPSGLHALSQNFGREPHLFYENKYNANDNLDKWTQFASALEYTAPKETEDGGLYMPVAFYKKDFVESGGFPEGNLYAGGFGKVDTPFIMSGDKYFFEKNHVMMNKRHITAMKSVVYHFQIGEMSE
jgi:hypothetical protein